MNDEERRRFREVAADCTPTMIGLAYLITGSQPAAERALRRALSKTARQWRVAQTAPERHILSALCRDQAGWRHRWTRAGLDDGAGVPSRGDDEDSDPDWYGLHRAMRRAVCSLPRPERVVIALQQYEDLTAVETAQVLGWSEDQVRHRTERARARLRDLLAELSAPDDSLGRQADDHDEATTAGQAPGTNHAAEGAST
jgi:DNA-directed RNA polymerase specialized sigma24 family protein